MSCLLNKFVAEDGNVFGAKLRSLGGQVPVSVGGLSTGPED